MGKSSRRQMGYDSSDEVHSEPISALSDSNAIKTRLQMDDLGNRSRDRQTAHDLKNDKHIDPTILEAIRKSNQRGTEESRCAEKNQDQLQMWTSFGGTDSTTNLDDIAGGQYHRAATMEKVKAEAVRLRAQGLEVNAESVDNPKVRPKRGANFDYQVRHNTQVSIPTSTKSGTRPLDPAVDSNRAYTYKPNRTKGRSKEKTNLKAAHPMKRQRLQNQLNNKLAAISSRTHLSDSISTCPVRQSNVQDTRWASTALLANPEPSRLGSATEVATPLMQYLNQKAHVPKSIPPPLESSKAYSEPEDYDQKSVAIPATQSTVRGVSDEPSDATELQKAQSQRSPSADGKVASKDGHSQIPDDVFKPEVFLEFMRRSTPLKQPYLAQSTASQGNLPKFQLDMTPKPQTWSKDPGSKTSFSSSLNDVPISSVPTYEEDAKDDLTDGRLTPIPLSDILNETSTDVSNSSQIDPRAEEPGTDPNSIVNTTSSHPASVTKAHLLDADIPTVDHGTLHPNDMPDIRLFGSHYYVRLPESWKPGAQLSPDMILAFKDTLRKLGILEEEVVSPATEIVSPVLGTSDTLHVYPVRNPSTGSADPRTLDERIVDAINPGFRQNLTSFWSQNEQRVTRRLSNGKSENHKPLTATMLLRSRSGNVSPKKACLTSKWAKYEPVTGQSRPAGSYSEQKLRTSREEAKNSLLGDSSTRPASLVSKNSIEDSKYAFKPTDQGDSAKHGSARYYVPAGPGFKQLRDSLLERGILPALSQPRHAAVSDTATTLSSDNGRPGDELFNYRDRGYSTSDESEL